jgi:hypothetical protein
VRKGTKFFSSPTTLVSLLPMNQRLRSMMGAPYPSKDETLSSDFSVGGMRSLFVTGSSGLMNWEFCSKPLNMKGSPMKPSSMSSIMCIIAGAYLNVNPTLVLSPFDSASLWDFHVFL